MLLREYRHGWLSFGSSTALFLAIVVLQCGRFPDAGKRRVYELEVEVKYPEDASDGDPAVGASPSQLFDYAANNGLYVDVTPTNVGVFAITFYRDAS